MKVETIKRLYEAKKYQKMAIMALLPEEARVHAKLLEKEMKAVIKECMIEIVTDNEKNSNDSSVQEDTKENQKGSRNHKVSKINIG